LAENSITKKVKQSKEIEFSSRWRYIKKKEKEVKLKKRKKDGVIKVWEKGGKKAMSGGRKA